MYRLQSNIHFKISKSSSFFSLSLSHTHTLLLFEEEWIKIKCVLNVLSQTHTHNFCGVHFFFIILLVFAPLSNSPLIKTLLSFFHCFNSVVFNFSSRRFFSLSFYSFWNLSMQYVSFILSLSLSLSSWFNPGVLKLFSWRPLKLFEISCDPCEILHPLKCKNTLLKPHFLSCLLHQKPNFSSFSNLATLFGYLPTLKRVATPSLRTAVLTNWIFISHCLPLLHKYWFLIQFFSLRFYKKASNMFKVKS